MICRGSPTKVHTASLPSPWPASPPHVYLTFLPSLLSLSSLSPVSLSPSPGTNLSVHTYGFAGGTTAAPGHTDLQVAVEKVADMTPEVYRQKMAAVRAARKYFTYVRRSFACVPLSSFAPW